MRMRINLLPTKISKKRAQNVQELIIMVVILVATLGGLLIWYKTLDNELNRVKSDIKIVKKQIAELDKEAAKVDQFKSDTKVLEDKLAVIEELKAKKTGPVIVLDELANAITYVGDVWIRKLDEKGGIMKLEMSSLRQDKISDFMVELEGRSKYFTDVKLLLTEAKTSNEVSYYDFSVTCQVLYAANKE